MFCNLFTYGFSKDSNCVKNLGICLPNNDFPINAIDLKSVVALNICCIW